MKRTRLAIRHIVDTVSDVVNEEKTNWSSVINIMALCIST